MKKAGFELHLEVQKNFRNVSKEVRNMLHLLGPLYLEQSASGGSD